MVFGNVVLWGFLIGVFLLVLLRHRRGRAGSSGAAPSLPEQLLAARFARAELNEEEYRSRLQVLTDTTGRPVLR